MARYKIVRRRRVLVCGDRHWDDRKIIYTVLDGELVKGSFNVISGMAPGADTYAAQWAERLSGMVTLMAFPADWNQFGRSAGPIRNRQMLNEGKPDIVYAFHDNLSESRGTKDMVTIARKAGLPVYVIGR